MGPRAHRNALSDSQRKKKLSLHLGKTSKEKTKKHPPTWNFLEAKLFTANNLISAHVWWSCAVCECWRKRGDFDRIAAKKVSWNVNGVRTFGLCTWHLGWVSVKAPLLSSLPLRFPQLPMRGAPEFIRPYLMTHFLDVSDSSRAPPGSATASPCPGM